ncbi:MAG: hypothetical protein KA841_04995 [Chitinophagales bacterium]|nr:hypothetical protein [Chitinophagales bacterium]
MNKRYCYAFLVILFSSIVLLPSCKKEINDDGDDNNNPPPVSTNFTLQWTDLPEFAIDQPGVPFGNYISKVYSTAYASGNMYALISDKFNIFRLVRLPSTNDTLHVVSLPFDPYFGKVFNYDDNGIIIAYHPQGQSITKVYQYSETGGLNPLPDLNFGTNQLYNISAYVGQVYAMAQTTDSTYVYRYNNSQWEIVGGSAFSERLPFYLGVQAGGGRIVAYGYNPPGTLSGGYYLKQFDGTQWQQIPLPAIDTTDLLTQHYMTMNKTGSLMALNQINYGTKQSKVFVYNFGTSAWTEHTFQGQPGGSTTMVTNLKFDELIPERLYATYISYPMQVSFYSLFGLKCLDGNTWTSSDSLPSTFTDPIDYIGYHPRGANLYFGWSMANSPTTGVFFAAQR